MALSDTQKYVKVLNKRKKILKELITYNQINVNYFILTIFLFNKKCLNNWVNGINWYSNVKTIKQILNIIHKLLAKFFP